jgi:glycopeptide antibiotics resistance protein
VASRTHFAAPLLLAVVVALILYVSLYPFEFATSRPTWQAALHSMSWARASRSDMFNNVLLYLPLGFCLLLLIEPRTGRFAALPIAALIGATLSLTLELLQASIESRVPSYTDLTLNSAGTLAGAIAGSAWRAFGSRITPHDDPQSHSRAVSLTIVGFWLAARLWPFVPELGLRQVRSAVRPLLEPSLAAGELVAYFIAWLIVAQALVHLVRRQRAVDALLLVVAAVLVGRTVVAGSTLSFAELVAIALVVVALVPLSRLTDRMRCTCLAVLLVAWLAWIAIAATLRGHAEPGWTRDALEHFMRQPPPAPQQILGKAFNYVALGWLFAGAGLLRHVAAGLLVLVVLGLCVLEPGASTSAYGWSDLAVAVLASVMIARWMPMSQPRARSRTH